MLQDTPSVKVVELDPVTMKKANLNADFAQLGVVPDTSIQEASPHFLLITAWKLLLKHSELGMRWQHSGKGGLAAASAWQPWKQIQGEGTQMAWVTASFSESTGCVAAENTCNYTR